MTLNVFSIRKLPTIYSWGKDPFDCTYHCDSIASKSLKIFTEYNIACEAQYLRLFELVRKDDAFLLKIFSGDDADVDVVGEEKGAVIDAVIEKIITKTTLGSYWENNNPDKKEKHLDEKEELRKILETLIGNFIG